MPHLTEDLEASNEASTEYTQIKSGKSLRVDAKLRDPMPSDGADAASFCRCKEGYKTTILNTKTPHLAQEIPRT